MQTFRKFTGAFVCFSSLIILSVSSARGGIISLSADRMDNDISSCNPTIQITTSANNICAGTVVSFSSAIADAGSNPVYHWKKNGLDVGSNTPVYSTNSLNNNDIIECELETDCSNGVVKSNAIIMKVSGLMPAISITASPNVTSCGEVGITLTAVTNNAGTDPTYQWKRSGSAITMGGNLPTYASIFSIHDTVVCELTTQTTCGLVKVSSAPFTFEGRNDLIPEVTISSTATTICGGTSVTFTATNVSGTSNPIYTWLLNGDTAGTNSTIFISNTLTDGSKIQCIMRVPQGCGGGSTKDYSDEITISVLPVLNPSITITSSSTEICKGTVVSFKASAKDTGNNPVYQWQLNGNNVGNNSTSFSTTNLSNGDVVRCVLDIGPQKCSNISSATSNAIPIKVHDVITPAINISTSNDDICSGEIVNFSATASGFVSPPVYQWFLNGSKTGNNNAAHSSSNLQDGDKLYCILQGNDQICQLEDTSNTIVMKVRQVPIINFIPADTSIMAGQQIKLNPSITGNISGFQWTPAEKLTDPFSLVPISLPLISNTTFKLTVEAANGCKAEKVFPVSVLIRLLMPNSFTPNGDGLNDVFRIPPGVNLKLKEFSIYDRWGNKIFTTTDINKGWNGKLNGMDISTGVFIYIVRGSNDKDTVFLKGTVTLIR